MTFRVRVVIPARNEQARIHALLISVFHALRVAEALGAAWQSEVLVVLDRCSDQTHQIAEQAGARVLACPEPGGKVEALRAGMSHEVDVHVCVDADVTLGARTLFDLVTTLEREPRVLACCPPLQPLPARGRATPLSWALHRYNAARGFSSERLWLSGRCYALRFVALPDAAEIGTRAARVERASFPGLGDPLLADDVWLSRALLAHDAQAIRHIETDPVAYRAPATLRGMSRTYRRLRRELRRIDLLFPELPAPGRDRKVDRLHGARDRVAYGIFQAALAVCRVHASLEHAQHAWLGTTPEPWPVIAESKR